MKRLAKSSTDKKICGVCGGIAAYLNCDPTIIRIICVILAFTTFGFWAYLICALVMPYDYEV